MLIYPPKKLHDYIFMKGCQNINETDTLPYHLKNIPATPLHK